MKNVIGIRRETKDDLERRAPISPDQVKELVEKNNLKVIVQPASQRKYTDEQYRNAGAILQEDLSECNIIFGVKEVPIPDLIPNKPFVFFSHTIKGQQYNMPLLKSILDQNITLIDYEPVTNEQGKRIIFFGRFAGIAGMIDSLWILGQRLKYEGYNTPFERIKQAVEYETLEEAENEISAVGKEIAENGLPDELTPLITGFTGRGNVSKGAQKIYELLPVEKISPGELIDLVESGNYSNRKVYSCEFYSPDLYCRKDGAEFNREDFYKHPDLYKSQFEKYIPYLTVLINGIYWEPEFDRLVTKQFITESYKQNKKLSLKVIGDITCDIAGSIELTQKATRYDNPCYVFNPEDQKIYDGWEGSGPVILAVDKLPTEIPREATTSFGAALLPFVPKLAGTDFSKEFDELDLPEEFRGAVIAHRGKLTPKYEYLYEHISRDVK